MVWYIAASADVERDAAGRPKLAVCLSYGLVADSADDGGVGARGFSACNVWLPGNAFSEQQMDANKALMLVKLKGQPLRHIDLLMVPRSELAMWMSGWVGSKELRKLVNKHAQTLVCTSDPNPLQRFKLNHRLLRDLRILPNGQPDPSYVAKRVTRLGVNAPLVAEEDVPRVFIGQEMYPREESEVWQMLQLPYRPFSDRNL
jgi:hypothetical protein